MKLFIKIVILLASFILLVEFALRFVFGFGSIPVFIEDQDYEYIFAPDQNLHRFGRYFYINHFSMRSDALATNDSIRILFFGDSILNGGPITDNKDVATSILEKNLSAKLKKKVRALNISASSWGPDNAAAYLKKHGDFGAKMIVLVFSSHDYFDAMGFERIVGVNSTYPTKNPSFAIEDFIMGYLIPAIKYRFYPKDNAKNEAFYYLESKTMNTGWNYFIEYCKSHRIPLLVYLHAQKSEAHNGEYNKYGQQLIQFLDSSHVATVLELNAKPDTTLYRDFIHFNKEGQHYMATNLEPAVLKMLTDPRP